MQTFVKMAIGPVSRLVPVDDVAKIHRFTNKGFTPVVDEDGNAVIVNSDELIASNTARNAQINNSDVLSLIQKSVAAKENTNHVQAPKKAAKKVEEQVEETEEQVEETPVYVSKPVAPVKAKK